MEQDANGSDEVLATYVTCLELSMSMFGWYLSTLPNEASDAEIETHGAFILMILQARANFEGHGLAIRRFAKELFHKIQDDKDYAETAARMCKYFIANLPGEFLDESVRDTHGNLIVGGFLFRKLFLNRVQENFERDDSHIGTARLIGELFNQDILTARVIHESVMKLLVWDNVPEPARFDCVWAFSFEQSKPKCSARTAAAT